MTEVEWLHDADLRRMLHFARAAGVGDRKLRLFPVSCCRLIGHVLTEARSRGAVEVAERFAEGCAREAELRAAYDSANAAAQEALLAVGKIGSSPHYVALFAVESSAISAAKRVCSCFHSAALVAAGSGKCPSGSEPEAQFTFLRDIRDDVEAMARAKETHAALPNLLRDIVGNPFRPVSLDSSWLAWNDGTIPKLAQAIYHDRAFDRLPILADALEEAGCSDQAILGHCRGPGPHVRGCWVVDTILGKT